MEKCTNINNHNDGVGKFHEISISSGSENHCTEGIIIIPSLPPSPLGSEQGGDYNVGTWN